MTIDKKSNPFSYGTDPELNRMFDIMIDLKNRVASQFAKAEKIAGFGDNATFLPTTEAKITLPKYESIRSPITNSFYGPKTVVPMDKVDLQVQAAIAAAVTHLAEVDEINKPVLEHNLRIREQVIEMMTRLGIPVTYSTYEYPSSRSKSMKSTTHTAGYNNDLQRVMPNSNVYAERAKLNSYISEFDRWKKKIIDEENKANIEKDEEVVRTKIMARPMLVQKLMEAGVNILDEVNKAMPGKKEEIIQYCFVKAIANEKAKINPSQILLDELDNLYDAI